MNNFILQFIPENLRTNSDIFRRSKLLVTLTFSLVGLSLLGLLQGLFQIGFTVFTAILLVAALFSFTAPFILRRSGSLGFTAQFIGILYSLICFSLNIVAGGFENDNRIYLLVTPLLMYLLLGIRSGIIFTLYTALLFAVLITLPGFGITLPPVSISKEQAKIMDFIHMFFCTHIYVHSCLSI